MTGCATVGTRGYSPQLQFKCLGATGFKGISSSGSGSMLEIEKISILGTLEFHPNHFHISFLDQFFYPCTALKGRWTLSSTGKYPLRAIRILC